MFLWIKILQKVSFLFFTSNYITVNQRHHRSRAFLYSQINVIQYSILTESLYIYLPKSTHKSCSSTKTFHTPRMNT